MSDIAIKFENISKQYRLGKIGTGTLSHDLKRWWTVSVRRQEDPYLKIGAVNDRSMKADSEYVWALRDINLEVKQGEVLGIIGKNGAGKSTLLKLLSRVTTPTTGRILSKGRIASLLEVGTGFHPEMTGRENIYMNGSIMGMNKAEITRKFEEIVEFAGVEKYIDTPVKRFSSGMTVRLGFAIAAHLEPEILVVDEVLAVGDADFQKKATGKMQEVSANGGRTVLFVSHNMESVNRLCNKSLLLSNGLIDFIGQTPVVIDRYLNEDNRNSRQIYESKNDESRSNVLLNRVVVFSSHGLSFFSNEEELTIEIEYEVLVPDKNIRIVLSIVNSNGIEVFSASDYYVQKKYKRNGKYMARINLPPKVLVKGTYFVRLRADIPKDRLLLTPYDYISFTINDMTFEQIGNRTPAEPKGIVHIPLKWEIEEI